MNMFELPEIYRLAILNRRIVRRPGQYIHGQEGDEERAELKQQREQFLSDQADAIYRDAELYIEALDSAESGEICDDEWRVDMKCERVRVRDARRLNDPEKYAEACVGMDDLAIKACRAYAEYRIQRGEIS